MAARSEYAWNAIQGCVKAYRLRRIVRHRATYCGATQLTGAFACKCASDLLCCWAEMPEVDMSDDMVMSSSKLHGAFGMSRIVHGRRQCRVSTLDPGINSVQTRIDTPQTRTVVLASLLAKRLVLLVRGTPEVTVLRYEVARWK